MQNSEHSFDPILPDVTLHAQFDAKPWSGFSELRMSILRALVLKRLESGNEFAWKDQTPLDPRTSRSLWNDSQLV